MYIKVHVKTDAKTEKIEKISNDRYDISVQEPAEGNRANERVLQIVRHIYGKGIVRIVSGHHAPAKIVSITNTD